MKTKVLFFVVVAAIFAAAVNVSAWRVPFTNIKIFEKFDSDTAKVTVNDSTPLIKDFSLPMTANAAVKDSMISKKPKPKVVLKKKNKVGKKKEEIVRKGPGPVRWKNPGVDPAIYDSAEQVWVKFGFSHWLGVMDSLKDKFKKGDYERYGSRWGEVWSEMVGGKNLIIYGTGRGVLNSWVNFNLILYGNMYRLDFKDRIMEVFKPDTCDNWCWRLVNKPITRDTLLLPCEKDTVRDTVNRKTFVHIPPDTMEKDSSKVEPLPKKIHLIFSRKGLYSWALAQSPYEYPEDLHECVGFRLNFFPRSLFFQPPEEGLAFGFDLYLNSWFGVGPRDTVPQYRGSNLRPAAGITLDWLYEKSRFYFYLNYGVQTEWGHTKGLAKKYKSFQLNQIANSGFVWTVSSSSEWKRWVTIWLDAGLDADDVGSGFDHKTSSYQGTSLTQSQDPKRSKSLINGGVSWFCLNVPTAKTSLVMGPGVNFLHVWENNSWHWEVNWSLDIDHWFVVRANFKNTSHSQKYIDNGNSFGLAVNASLFDIGKYKKPAEVWK
jgi:hypothetical protein